MADGRVVRATLFRCRSSTPYWKPPSGPGCGIRLPFDPKDQFGAARAPVAVSVERPSQLLDALAGDARAREVFDGLSHTHRREYARWVDEAEREPTRLARATNAVAMPRDGVCAPG